MGEGWGKVELEYLLSGSLREGGRDEAVFNTHNQDGLETAAPAGPRTVGKPVHIFKLRRHQQDQESSWAQRDKHVTPTGGMLKADDIRGEERQVDDVKVCATEDGRRHRVQYNR